MHSAPFFPKQLLPKQWGRVEDGWWGGGGGRSLIERGHILQGTEDKGDTVS